MHSGLQKKEQQKVEKELNTQFIVLETRNNSINFPNEKQKWLREQWYQLQKWQKRVNIK